MLVHLLQELKRSKIEAKLKQSYRPIRCTYKLLEWLVHNRIVRIIVENVPTEEKGFKHGRGCCDQVLALTSYTRAVFQQKLKVCAEFLDITSAYNKFCREGVIYKLLKLIPFQYMARPMQDMLCSRNFQIIVNGELSGSNPIINGLPKGSALAGY